MSYFSNAGQSAYGSFAGGSLTPPTNLADPDIGAQGLNQRLLAGTQGDIAARQLAAQQQFQASQQGADREFQNQQAQNARTGQGQMLEAQGRIGRDAAQQQFGFTHSLADQQNAATQALHNTDFANTRTLGADQFGFTRQLADQQNAFTSALQQAGFGAQRQLSAQEAGQTLTRDQSQFGHTTQLNDQQNAAAKALQADALGNQLKLGELSSSTQLGTAGIAAGASRYGADQQLAGQRYGSDAQLAAAHLPVDFAREKLNRILPLLSAAGGGTAGAATVNYAGSGLGGGGAPAAVYSPQQIDAQVNAAAASNATRTAGQTRGIQQDAAARGLSSQSPVTAALMQGAEGQRMMADADSSRQIQYDAAKGNADQATSAAQLREQARQTDVQTQVNAQQIAANQRNAYLAALAGAL